MQIDTLLEPGSYYIELSNLSAGNVLVLYPYTNFSQLNTPEVSFLGGYPFSIVYNYFFKWKIKIENVITR